jgi:hypothetical protein
MITNNSRSSVANGILNKNDRNHNAELKRTKTVAFIRSEHFMRTNNSTFGRRNGTRICQFSPSLISYYYFAFWHLMASITAFYRFGAIALQQQPSPSRKSAPTVQGLPVHRAPLRWQQQQQDELSPYCFALSSILDLPVKSNILATQVWPSARVAAMTLEECIRSNLGSLVDDGGTEGTNKFTICELGCGPGLPSLTAAVACASRNATVDVRVIATDIDEFALDLVNAAAKEQGLDHIVSTRPLDLIQAGDEDWTGSENAWLKRVDLFVMSDVFEVNAVAVGAARFTQRVLSWPENDRDNGARESRRKRMWVFAQTDRAQREVFLQELQNLSSAQNDNSNPSLEWKSPASCNLKDRLWLCDVDETEVDYG